MDVFPAFFPLAGRVVVVAGEGEAADAKARLFEHSPARVRRISGDEARLPLSYMDAVLVFIAETDEALAATAAAAAKSVGAVVNVVDRPALCDFTTPAIVDRGAVVAAVGTGGASPMLASLLRRDLETRLPEGLGALAELLRDHQAAIRAAMPNASVRRAFLREVIVSEVAARVLAGDRKGGEDVLLEAIERGVRPVGAITFVNAAGPAEDLTLKAARRLSEADLLVVDEGAAADVLELARRDAPREPAGQTPLIDLAARALQGRRIVRLTVDDNEDERAVLQSLGAPVEVCRG